MPGVRIHHPTLRSCIILIPHPGQFRRGFKVVNKGRKPKDYRLTLDVEGNAIVSETIWMRLEEAREAGTSQHGFLVLNNVPDPPSQTIGFRDRRVETPATYKQVRDALREIAPPGVKHFTVVEKRRG